MSKENTTMELHCFACAACREHPYGITAQHHRAINRLVAWADEHRRRQLVAPPKKSAQPQTECARFTGCDRAGARGYAAFLGFFFHEPS